MRRICVRRLMTETAFNESAQIDPAAQHADMEQAAPIVTPGVQLAGRRQQLNLTIEQVANQLNLAPRQIQALEADNYGALPGMASVRGFIRAYAKLLKIDAEPLVQAIAHEVTATSVEPLGPALSTTPFSDGRSPLVGRRFPISWLIALAVLGGLAVLGLAGQRLGWWPVLSQSFSLKMDKGLTLLPGSGPHEAEPDAASATATAGRDAGEADAKTAAPATVVVSEIPANVAVPAQAEPAQPAAAPPAEPPAKVSAAAEPAANDLLVLKLREDSWIDIRRSNNTPLISRLARAGEVETVKVNGPLALTIGNAAGVDVTLRGKPIELETEVRSDVARLTLK
jgi:cytoskeleton protein RodZ